MTSQPSGAQPPATGSLPNGDSTRPSAFQNTGATSQGQASGSRPETNEPGTPPHEREQPEPDQHRAAPSEPPSQPSASTSTSDTPASPPLPAKHLPITPGPRAARLQELFATSLRHTLNKISWDNMAACYPTIAANAPNLLRDVRSTMVARLHERCQSEFDKILEARHVVPKLNELESLVSEAAARRIVGDEEGAEAPIPPHQLPAEAIVAAHISRPLAAQRSQFNARLQNNQALNERLFGEIEEQRAEIERLLAALERALADVDGANGLLTGVADEVAREARDVEVEMTGV
ncbi:hypothetical protein BROUX41_004324 [Berkeleyomyces rouxiae]|uniref:uncharacterized protein n=1 Tax=Berkeleyomyces rouxiae TaxID=2035830 RepID=UPI003B826921